jgi:hypothetical protein
MLGAHVPVAELVGCGDRLIEYHSGPRSIGQIRRICFARRSPFGEHLLNRYLKIDWSGAQVLEDIHYESVLLCQKSEEEVLCSHVLMMAATGIFSRLDERPTQPGVEIVTCQDDLLAKV